MKFLFMATYRTSVSSPRRPEDVFRYLARFSNAAQWDPGVSSGEDMTPGAPAKGSTYRLVVRFLGLSVPLQYRIEEIDAPKRGGPPGGELHGPFWRRDRGVACAR